MDDRTLLRQYVENHADEAFAALVARHVNLVYSMALRQTGHPQNAEEITQEVFVTLAKKAGQLRHAGALSSWLFQTTRLTAANFVRSEIRRRHREEEAYMQSVVDESANEVWPKIAPLLDSAVASLREKDRQAVILRFYEGRNLREIGHALGASEDAAEKRLSRALEKLRRFFAQRGVGSTPAILAGAMSAHSAHAAPAALAHSVTVVAVAKGAVAGSSTLTLTQGALKFMAWTKVKTAMAVSVAIILATTMATTLIVHHQHQLAIRPLPPGQTEFPRASWGFAGYGDPHAALMSYLWASVCQSNRTVFETSLTPREKSAYQQMLLVNRQVPQLHSEAATVADTFKRADEEWQKGSFKILDEQAIASDQILLHVEAQRTAEKMEVYIKMTKFGSEWKFDGIQKRKRLASTSRP